ncbi:MAG: sugar transferase [Phycisphaerae bacterium]
MAKRSFDLLFSVFGLLLLWPLFLLAWLTIKLDDGGPALFRQIRIGQNGRPFRILKFRSMRIDLHENGPNITATGDVRITRAGQWLRHSKVDELPQLWNVLRGDMSFVGPRPEVPRYVDLYSRDQRAVLDLRPGITDEASIEFRDEEKLLAAASDPEQFYIEYCMPRKIALNLTYAQRANLSRDLGVILRTVSRVWLCPSSR